MSKHRLGKLKSEISIAEQSKLLLMGEYILINKSILAPNLANYFRFWNKRHKYRKIDWVGKMPTTDAKMQKNN